MLNWYRCRFWSEKLFLIYFVVKLLFLFLVCFVLYVGVWLSCFTISICIGIWGWFYRSILLVVSFWPGIYLLIFILLHSFIIIFLLRLLRRRVSFITSYTSCLHFHIFRGFRFQPGTWRYILGLLESTVLLVLTRNNSIINFLKPDVSDSNNELEISLMRMGE